MKGVNAPALGLPEMLEDGMLSPAPSESAAAALEKYPHSVTRPELGESAQVVVMLIVALPFATPFGGSAKFTDPGAADTVKDVARLAFRFTLPMVALT